MKSFFKKKEYRFLVESTNIENVIPHTKLLTNKTNKKVSTKWTYHKQGSFASRYFFVVENLVSV